MVRYDQQPLVFNSRYAAWRYKRKLGKSEWQIVRQPDEFAQMSYGDGLYS